MAEIATWANTNLPTASTTTAGVVKVDGSTITIASGVISGVSPAPYGSLPAMDGTANAGAVSAWSRGDHVHPIDTSRAPLASPALTGAPTAPTPTTGDNSTKLATTAFVQAQMVASGAGVSTWNTRAGAVVLQQSDLVAQGDFHDTGRNLVMNGAFAVQQRGQGPWTVAGMQTADRWQLSFGGSDTNSVTIIALTDADRTAIGDESATSALQQVVTGSAVANSYSAMTQHVENVRRLGGRLVTVSFWARATAGTPRVGITLQQNFGSGGSPSAATQVSAGATAALSSTWTRYTINGTFLSTVGKTLGTNNDHYSQLALWFSDVSNVGGNAIGQQSGTIQLYGIQLEIGTVATPFDAGGTPADQLRQCQRFYQTGTVSWFGYIANGTAGYNKTLICPMRANPTIAGLSGCSASQINGQEFLATVVTGGTGNLSFNSTYTASADL